MFSALCLHPIRILLNFRVLQSAAEMTEETFDVARRTGFIGEAYFINGNNDKWYG